PLGEKVRLKIPPKVCPYGHAKGGDEGEGRGQRNKRPSPCSSPQRGEEEKKRLSLREMAPSFQPFGHG
ncbi:MAG: hypothetical protein WBC42_12425, partial [Candidatus Zixiibacteriota bacterium]